ncbi:MAG: DUF3418 domain-containing protein, partial [Kutzneria sp.]|nr:DUF3418 domain-containing protein [Kutzneria sp.]
LAASANDIERDGVRTWDFPPLPRVHRQEVAGYQMTTYPALVDRGEDVSVRMLDSESAQRRAMWLGTRRLLLLNVPSPVKLVVRSLSNDAKLTLSRNPHGGVPALLRDCVTAAVDKLLADGGGPAWDADGFGTLLASIRSGLGPTTLDVVERVRRILAAEQAVRTRLARTTFAPVESIDDIQAQLNALVRPDFVTATGWRRLPDVERYLRAVDRRLEKLPENPGRDVERTRQIGVISQECRELAARAGEGQSAGERLESIRWMLEELRVSYFAQSLGTAYPVSEKRIRRAMDEVAAGSPAQS